MSLHEMTPRDVENFQGLAEKNSFVDHATAGIFNGSGRVYCEITELEESGSCGKPFYCVYGCIVLCRDHHDELMAVFRKRNESLPFSWEDAQASYAAERRKTVQLYGDDFFANCEEANRLMRKRHAV